MALKPWYKVITPREDRFQQTRGILRLLALWVANAYPAGFKGAHRRGRGRR
ncbi:MAG TPA: hypothetical protein VKM72_13950 [Thermoanaerobaculia bacterium]|nr:hypothetical protein [Thermoanaerobaculia bacterium]